MPGTWFAKLPNLDSINQMIFTSTNSVEYFISELSKNNLSIPKHIKINAIGEASAQHLIKLGVHVDYIPNPPNSEQLLSLQNMQNVDQEHILLIKGQDGRELIAEELAIRGAILTPVIVYKRCLPIKNTELVNSIWRNNSVDIILFTSYQSMQNIFTLFGESARQWLLSKPCVVISERLAEKAKYIGIKEIIIANYNDILATLEGFKNDSEKRRQVNRHK